MSHDAGHLDPHEKRQISRSWRPPVLLAAGGVVLVISYVLASMFQDAPRRFWLAYVHNYAFFLSLSLGALFFVLLQHLTRSGWSVVVRRPAEVMAANLLVLAGLLIPIAAVVASGSGLIYPWARPVSAFLQAGTAEHAARTPVTGNPAPDRRTMTVKHAVAAAEPQVRLVADVHDAGVHNSADVEALEDPAAAQDAPHAGGHEAKLILGKRPYLNPPFFIVRWAMYFVVWAGLGWWFWKRSLRQDESGDVRLSLSMQSLSAPAMLAFALTATLASFDLLMSLDPAWFSTIYGVYFFAGCVVGFFALLITVLAGLQKRGLLTTSITAEHYHDLGKLLFAFVFFWAYIAFSQYMLIWYGDIPEETGWYFRRGCATQAPNVWSYVIVLLLLGHFLVPFVALLNRRMKRQRKLLVFWAGWMLVFHWIDLYWLVMPELTTTYLPLGIAEFGCLLGLGAIFAAGLVWLAEGRSLIAVRDPRLRESLVFQNL